MCLIIFAYRVHPDFPLILAANRDEYYSRPSAPADFWPDYPDILAGRDLQMLGTWLGITKGGRLAALTNFRNPRDTVIGARSRGELPLNYLLEESSPEAYLARLSPRRMEYNGFNLLLGRLNSLFWYARETDRIERVTPGIHALSNHLLDTPWPKAVKGIKAMTEALRQPLSAGGIFQILADDRKAPDADLPDTGVGLVWERLLSPVFISSPDYGTRCSTVLIIDRLGRVEFIERTYSGNLQELSERRFHLHWQNFIGI